MKKYTLQGNKRDIVGRKVKALRKSGIIPATVYGKKVTSESVSVPLDAFLKVYSQAGETGVVELSINGSEKPVLIHHVQRDPVDSSILHIEFYQVDLKEKVRTRVPLEVVGESPAVLEKKGVVLTLISEIEVEALPTDLPERIEVDVSKLTDVDQEIQVSGLRVPSGVEVLTDKDVSVVKIGELVSKEAEAQAAEAASAAEEESTEGEEESKPEEGKKEESKEEQSEPEKKEEKKE